MVGARPRNGYGSGADTGTTSRANTAPRTGSNPGRSRTGDDGSRRVERVRCGPVAVAPATGRTTVTARRRFLPARQRRAARSSEPRSAHMTVFEIAACLIVLAALFSYLNC